MTIALGSSEGKIKFHGVYLVNCNGYRNRTMEVRRELEMLYHNIDAHTVYFPFIILVFMSFLSNRSDVQYHTFLSKYDRGS